MGEVSSSDVPLTVQCMASNDDVLRGIDAKVSALLVLVLDAYLRQTGLAKPKPRSVDMMLADVGLPTGTIAKLLGKTDRAVQKQLAGERAKKARTRKARSRKVDGDGTAT